MILKYAREIPRQGEPAIIKRTILEAYQSKPTKDTSDA